MPSSLGQHALAIARTGGILNGADPCSQKSFYRVRTTAPVRSARPKLLNNLGYNAGTNRFSTFADSKTYTFIDRNRLLKLDN